MAESLNRVPTNIRRIQRASHDVIARWASVAEQSEGVTFRVLDLSEPAERAAAVYGFDEQRDVYKFGGAAIVARAEAEGHGVMQYSGSVQAVGDLARAANEAVAQSKG